MNPEILFKIEAVTFIALLASALIFSVFMLYKTLKDWNRES